MGMIDSPDNGATEVPGTSHNSLMIFLAGPIRYWWTPGVRDTRICRLYLAKREEIFYALSEDYLVYAPHRAIRGPWDKRAQIINDAAVYRCDAFVNLNAGVPMDGTKEERSIAVEFKIPIFEVFVGDNYSVDAQLASLRPKLDKVSRRV